MNLSFDSLDILYETTKWSEMGNVWSALALLAWAMMESSGTVFDFKINQRAAHEPRLTRRCLRRGASRCAHCYRKRKSKFDRLLSAKLFLRVCAAVETGFFNRRGRQQIAEATG